MKALMRQTSSLWTLPSSTWWHAVEMDVTTALLPFAAEFAPKLDGRETLKETISGVLEQPDGESKKIPFKIIEDDTASLLRQALGLVLLGILLAIPGYWILGENCRRQFLHLAAEADAHAIAPNIRNVLP